MGVLCVTVTNHRPAVERSGSRTGRERRAVWLSTSLDTPGGMTTFVRTMRETPLWTNWRISFIETHCYGSKRARLRSFLRGMLAFLRALAARDVAIVHLHSGKGGSFVRKAILLWMAKLAGVPTVLHVHAGWFGMFYSRAPVAAKWLIRRTLSAADAVVALGDLWAGRLQEISPSARMVAIPNGIPIVGATAPDHADGRLHVVYLGRINEAKGAFDLLDAWPGVVEKLAAGPVPRLTIAGDGQVGRAREVVESADLGGSVQVLPWQSGAEIDALLATADVLVLPSYNEGQPMSVLEAMARGICVVATRVGGIPELVEHGRSGLLIAPGDLESLTGALVQTLSDGSLRHSLGAGALSRARQEFDIDVIWERFDALYREIVESSATRHP